MEGNFTSLCAVLKAMHVAAKRLPGKVQCTERCKSTCGAGCAKGCKDADSRGG